MHKKHRLRFSLTFVSVFLALGVVGFVGPAQAGFQWVEPTQESAAPAVTIERSPAVQMGTLGSVRVDTRPSVQLGSAARPVPYDDLPSVQIGKDYAATSTGSARAAPSEPKTSVAPVPSASDSAIVEGFADRVPLSVALRQVLPQDIGFSVDPSISLGTVVSWKGGAPWATVLKDMLLPHGLSYEQQGQLVHVVRVTDTPTLTMGGKQATIDRVPAGVSVSTTPDSTIVTTGTGTTVSVSTQGTSVTTSSVGPSASAPIALQSGGQPMNLLPPASAPAQPAYAPPAPAPVMPAPAKPLAPSSGYLVPPSHAISIAPSAAYETLSGSWIASKGDTLKKVLDDWSRRSGVELNWQAEYDYPVQASVSFAGSFEEAVRALLTGFKDAKPQPMGFLYNNQAAGQTVLVIQTRGNNYNE